MPEKLRKSPKITRTRERLAVTVVPRRFLPLFPECYEVEETFNLAESYSPQVPRRDTLEAPLSPGRAGDNKRRGTLTPKSLMR